MTDYFLDNRSDVYFDRYLPPAGDVALDILQLGAFRGSATAWLYQRFPNASITDVDTWQGPGDPGIDWAEVEADYDAKRVGWQRHLKVKASTRQFFIQPRRERYHFVYVDAEHTTDALLRDAKDAWRVLRPGGLMAIDDGNQDFAIEAIRNLFLPREDARLIDDGSKQLTEDLDPRWVISQIWIKKAR